MSKLVNAGSSLIIGATVAATLSGCSAPAQQDAAQQEAKQESGSVRQCMLTVHSEVCRTTDGIKND